MRWNLCEAEEKHKHAQTCCFLSLNMFYMEQYLLEQYKFPLRHALKEAELNIETPNNILCE